MLVSKISNIIFSKNLKNIIQTTALHYAVQTKNDEIIEFLLKHENIDVNIKNNI